MLMKLNYNAHTPGSNDLLYYISDKKVYILPEVNRRPRRFTARNLLWKIRK